MLEPGERHVGGVLRLLDLLAARGVVHLQGLFDIALLAQCLIERNGIFHRELGARADREVGGRLRVADQDRVPHHPGLVGDRREIPPERAVVDELVAFELVGEHVLDHRQHLGLGEPVETEVAPGGFIRLDDPGGAIGLVLITVRNDQAFLGLAEEILERVEWLGRAEPGEFVRAQVEARLEVLLVLLPDARVDAVGDDDQVRVLELGDVLHVALEAHVDAELAPAVLQDVEERHARAATEAIAAGAQRLALVNDVDVAPVGEAAPDALVGDKVVGLERIERLVGEHHAEAERIVRTVSLVDRDVPARPRLLREQREVKPSRAAADDGDFHGTTAVASISSLASGSIKPLTSTTAITGKWRPISAR